MALLEQGTSSPNPAESAKLTREVFKHLTSEDLYHLALHDGQRLADYERKYNQVEGVSELESELARVILRYVNEGRVVVYSQQEAEAEQAAAVVEASRKQVRFENDGSQLI